MENSERLGRQERQKIEPGTSRLHVLNTELLGHWWGFLMEDFHPTIFFKMRNRGH